MPKRCKRRASFSHVSERYRAALALRAFFVGAFRAGVAFFGGDAFRAGAAFLVGARALFFFAVLGFLGFAASDDACARASSSSA
jgi:hypothetical protein